MSFEFPWMLAVAALVLVGLGLAYRLMHLRRTQVLGAAGLAESGGRRARIRRHVPPMLFLVALTLLLAAGSRPQATIKVPRISGTIILAFDVSNSMTATDVSPSRLAAAQAAATRFVRAQPDTVDIGIVAFDQGALTTHTPTTNHDQTISAIKQLHAAGGTSLGQAILASLSAIVGHTVALPDPNSNDPPPNFGYLGSATIVLLSDGENTGGPDPVSAAGLAANAGVRIDTVGVGTVAGATISVDGYQVATALNEDLLTQIAQTTAGSYHLAADAQSLDSVYRSLDLRITAKAQFVELTGATIGLALLLLTIGGMLMITWYGRVL
jgi:Ca-activated chloride channel family protein